MIHKKPKYLVINNYDQNGNISILLCSHKADNQLLSYYYIKP